jgi:hypothetical protein
MTAARRPRHALEPPPARPHLLARAHRDSPELAVLALLDDALLTALVVLHAEHPALHTFDPPVRAHPLDRARHLVRTIGALRDAIDRYRRAVLRDLGAPAADQTDLPF